MLSNTHEIRHPQNTQYWWGAIPYPIDELHDKTVDFRLEVAWEERETPLPMAGNGRFFIRKSKKGFHVQIVVQYSEEREKVIDLTEAAVRLIKREPEGSKCGFSLYTFQP